MHPNRKFKLNGPSLVVISDTKRVRPVQWSSRGVCSLCRIFARLRFWLLISTLYDDHTLYCTRELGRFASEVGPPDSRNNYALAGGGCVWSLYRSVLASLEKLDILKSSGSRGDLARFDVAARSCFSKTSRRLDDPWPAETGSYRVQPGSSSRHFCRLPTSLHGGGAASREVGRRRRPDDLFAQLNNDYNT